MTHTRPTTHRPSARLFCLRAISVGVQLAMLGTPVWSQFFFSQSANASDTPVIKRQKNPQNTTSADTLTHQPRPYSGGTDNALAGSAQDFSANLTALTQEVPTDTQVADLGIFGEQTERPTKPTPDSFSIFNTPTVARTNDNRPLVRTQKATNIRSSSKLDRLYQRPADSCQGQWHYPAVDSTLTGNGLTASANYGYYDNNRYGELAGDVQIRQGDRSLFAQKVALNLTTGQAKATGQVLFSADDNPSDDTQNAIIGMADDLNYNLNTGQAVAHDVAFAHNGLHAHGYAKGLVATDPNETVLTGTSFSTCPPDRRLWELSADNITLNKATGRGIAKHTALKIHNQTLIKLPYFNFPIDDRRSSGFLLPNVGINSPDGLEVSVPYYFNLAPNYDATLTPTVFSNKNPRLAGEFRYLTQDFGQGKLHGAILPKDRKYDDKHRGHLFFDHEWSPSTTTKEKFGNADWLNNVKLSATYRHISDSGYLSDFDSLGINNNALNLPRRLTLSYETENLTARLNAETFQKLNGNDINGRPFLDKDRPYARLPQLSVKYTLPTKSTPQTLDWLDDKVFHHLPTHFLDNLKLTGTHDVAYFKKSITDNSDSEKSGVRAYHKLEASYPMSRAWGYLHPKFSLAHLHTAYDEASLDDHNLTKKDGKYSVTVPSLSVETGLFFQKDGVPFGWLDKQSGGYQLISPRLKYLNSGYQNQDNMPNFETSVASLSYDQLLADSWFLGYDRLSDLHAITPAINYRYIDKLGQTRVEFGVAEQFFLSDIKVGLDGNPSQAITTKGKSTGLSWQASVSPYQGVWLEGAGSLKRNYSPNALMLSARYQPNATTLFNVGMVNRKADLTLGQLPLSAYTGSAIFSIKPNWQIIAQAQYDTQKSKIMDTLLGVNYEDCCLGVSIYGRAYRNDLRPNDTPHRAIMAELRLSGLTSKGQLNRLLSEKILGFDNIDKTWRGTPK